LELREYDTMRAVEDLHWWYQGLWRLTLDWLTRRLAPGGGPRILDAGCGTGGLLARLRQRYPAAAGVELSPEALAHCRTRGLACLARGSVTDLPFGTERFDAVISNDVLYHRQVEVKPALRELHRVLRPGGLLLMNLAALESQRGAHDEAVHTARRFERDQVRQLLEDAGFTIERLSYRNFLLFPVAWAVRRFVNPSGSHPAGKSDVRLPSGPVNALLTAVLQFENRLLERLDLPFGLSLYCAARRSDAR
jgi:SAM-dependent methyltransferase